MRAHDTSGGRTVSCAEVTGQSQIPRPLGIWGLRSGAWDVLRRQQADPRSAEFDRVAVFHASLELGLRVVRLSVAAAPARLDFHRAVAADLNHFGVGGRVAAVEGILPLVYGDGQSRVVDQELFVV